MFFNSTIKTLPFKNQPPSRSFCKNRGVLPKKIISAVSGDSASSTAWLRRQLTDPYVKKAHDEGFPSRAAYKLAELDDKYHFLRPGRTVIDLGAAPGGWSLVACKRVNSIENLQEEASTEKKGIVISVDLQELQMVRSNHVIIGDFMEEKIQKEILDYLKGRRVDVLLSDMAPAATGQRDLDHIKLIDLNLTAMKFADLALKNGGTLILKSSRGGEEGELKKMLEKKFHTVKYAKPEASRTDSAELFLYAAGFKKPAVTL